MKITDVDIVVISNGGDTTEINQKIIDAYDNGALSGLYTAKIVNLTIYDSRARQLVEAWSLTNFPAVVFLSPEHELSFYAIDGHRVTDERLQKVIDIIPNIDLTGDFNQIIDEYGNFGEVTKMIEKEVNGLGFGLGSPISSSWLDCNKYLPPMVCSISIWIPTTLLLILIILVIYKIVK